uniref:Uncharacterized protein n=1 Tax=Opuntia streptacantha TaxID=393608 RepID=A0A7C8ZZ89_OPUST
MLILPIAFDPPLSITGIPPTPFSFISLKAWRTGSSSYTLTTCLALIRGSPRSVSFLAPQFSNQWSPMHSANMWITADCVMMFSIFAPPTTGTLFILYFESSSRTVNKEFESCKARNGAHRNVPEMSRTVVFLYRSDAVRAPKKFPEVTAADLGLKLACFVLQLTPLAATAAAMPLLLSFGSTLLDSSVSD